MSDLDPRALGAIHHEAHVWHAVGGGQALILSADLTLALTLALARAYRERDEAREMLGTAAQSAARTQRSLADLRDTVEAAGFAVRERIGGGWEVSRVVRPGDELEGDPVCVSCEQRIATAEVAGHWVCSECAL